MRRLVLCGWLALLPGEAGALDVDALWDFAQPALSEQRFRAALVQSAGDEALVLRTQIARTHSLRGRFDEAHRELDAVQAALAGAGPEPFVRALLERGRTLRSAGDPAAARPWFEQAFERADRAGLQVLAADALHMVALVEPTLAGQLHWNRRTVDYARAAADPKARRWVAPALNNAGDALRAAGRLDESLASFREALAAYEAGGRAGAIRFARWQVANVLRLQGRLDEALAMQLALEREAAGAGAPDAAVFDELARLYAARGEAERAAHYRRLQAEGGRP